MVSVFRQFSDSSGAPGFVRHSVAVFAAFYRGIAVSGNSQCPASKEPGQHSITVCSRLNEHGKEGLKQTTCWSAYY